MSHLLISSNYLRYLHDCKSRPHATIPSQYLKHLFYIINFLERIAPHYFESKSSIMSTELTQLRKLLIQHYSLDEFRTLCFDLGILYDNLGGDGLSGKARELLLLIGRQQRFAELLHHMQTERPDLDMTGLTSTLLQTSMPASEPPPANQ